MKNTLYLVIIIFATAGCSEDRITEPNMNVQEVKDVVTNGRWMITYFFDTDKEETDKFNGYTFDFGSGGTLNALKGPITHSGSWSVTDEGNSDSFEDMDFNISFAAPEDFAELSEDWEITSLSNSKIALRHVSGGNGGTDLLTFEKK